MTCEYYFDGGAAVPVRVHTVVVSVQHSEKVRKHFISLKKGFFKKKTFFFQVSLEALRADIMEKVVKSVIPARYLDDQVRGKKRSIFLKEKFAKMENEGFLGY